MKKIAILLPFLFSFLIDHAQQALSSNWISKMSPLDSLTMSVERRNAISGLRRPSKTAPKNILILSPAAKATKDQDAQYLGQLEKKEVYKVNTKAVSSKYAAEAEKNLELLFTKAADKGWVLFFDEANQLFSRSENPQSTANYIQKLAQAKNVTAIFWCEDDCLTWMKNSRYVLVQ